MAYRHCGYKKDPDFLCDASGRLEAAAAQLLSELCPEHTGDWEISVIYEQIEAAASVMRKRGLPACHPWEDEDECICYASPNRCSFCTHSHQ